MVLITIIHMHSTPSSSGLVGPNEINIFSDLENDLKTHRSKITSVNNLCFIFYKVIETIELSKSILWNISKHISRISDRIII